MIWICVACVLALICLVVSFLTTKKLTVTNYTITDKKITQPLTIVHLSDLHNDTFGPRNANLNQLIKQCKPDLILITGDFLDKRRTDISTGLIMAQGLVSIAPVYMVTGNHESKIPQWDQYETQLHHQGFHFIHNKRLTLKGIDVIGLYDVRFYSVSDVALQKQYLHDNLKNLSQKTDRFSILLSHQPQFFDIYKQYPIDLSLCGHAHGGQVRLPFIGGLFAPQQGLFPKYTSGVHSENNRRMIVSRGIGNSLFPLRFLNNPEIVVIKLEPEE